MRIQLTGTEVRSWCPDDALAIARHANNRKIWQNLRDAFPHPYSLDDARRFLEKVEAMKPESYFAIASESEAIGSIGFTPHPDVERFTAEIGYWLSEEHWGKGIATEALTAVTRYAIEIHHLHRLYATPYAWNPASFRVLEKAGYLLEGTLRQSSFKDGRFVDQRLYAFVAQQ